MDTLCYGIHTFVAVAVIILQALAVVEEIFCVI
jgi:hypothetical protein